MSFLVTCVFQCFFAHELRTSVWRVTMIVHTIVIIMVIVNN